MERFAIKIDKSVKSRLKNCCRLCGIDNPNQINILDKQWIESDGEPTLSDKILDCVGIQVTKNDKMPQRICSLCSDKINDFFEFREMCAATNIQTRKLLNIPEAPKQIPKKQMVDLTEGEGESIFGIVGDDAKAKEGPPLKISKKSKKSAVSTLPSTSNDNRFRGMTKREIEITLELERIKQEEEEDEMKARSNFADVPANRSKAGRKRKNKLDTDGSALGPLLAPKELNQRERQREKELKKIERKRKSDPKNTSASALKKIKKEPGNTCTICCDRFFAVNLLDSHMQINHIPKIADFGCSSCNEQFFTENETKLHHEWHKTANVAYKCVVCEKSYEKMISFQRHMATCRHISFAKVPLVNDIHCDICQSEFETKNLFDWHGCFIKNNAPCPKCHRVFVKKAVLFKHLFRCNGSIATSSKIVVEIPRRGKQNKRSAPIQATPIRNVKSEPEATIIETNAPNDIDDDRSFDASDFMESHFAESDDDNEIDNSISSIPVTANEKEKGMTAKKKIPTKAQGKAQTESKIADNTTKRGKTVKVANTASAVVNDTIDNQSVILDANSQLLLPSLLECQVKIEPIDFHGFPDTIINHPDAQVQPTENTVVDPEPTTSIETTSRAASPPTTTLTPPTLNINIKKEIMHPGYGDVFDPVLARNIKKEKPEGIARKRVINPIVQKPTKLYKKPALLAIKIKQERFERERTQTYSDGEVSDYHDYAIGGQDDYIAPMLSPTQSDLTLPQEVPALPVITQIHSVIEAGNSNFELPIISNVLAGDHLSMMANQSDTGGIAIEKIPFKPIKIKSEFRKQISPAKNTVDTSIENDSTGTANKLATDAASPSTFIAAKTLTANDSVDNVVHEKNISNEMEQNAINANFIASQEVGEAEKVSIANKADILSKHSNKLNQVDDSDDNSNLNDVTTVASQEQNDNDWAKGQMETPTSDSSTMGEKTGTESEEQTNVVEDDLPETDSYEQKIGNKNQNEDSSANDKDRQTSNCLSLGESEMDNGTDNQNELLHDTKATGPFDMSDTIALSLENIEQAISNIEKLDDKMEDNERAEANIFTAAMNENPIQQDGVTGDNEMEQLDVEDSNLNFIDQLVQEVADTLAESTIDLNDIAAENLNIPTVLSRQLDLDQTDDEIADKPVNENELLALNDLPLDNAPVDYIDLMPSAALELDTNNVDTNLSEDILNEIQKTAAVIEGKVPDNSNTSGDETEKIATEEMESKFNDTLIACNDLIRNHLPEPESNDDSTSEAQSVDTTQRTGNEQNEKMVKGDRVSDENLLEQDNLSEQERARKVGEAFGLELDDVSDESLDDCLL